MTRDEPAKDVGHPRLFLAGDFASPAEVLAAGSLSDEHKREILNVWRRDLLHTGGWAEHRQLLVDIDETLARLGANQDQSGRRP